MTLAQLDPSARVAYWVLGSICYGMLDLILLGLIVVTLANLSARKRRAAVEDALMRASGGLRGRQ